jgi:hypothetical protein
MAKTSLFTVNAVGDPEPVTATVVSSRIEIGEDPSQAGWPTTDYLVRSPLALDSPRQMPAGTIYVFTKPNKKFFMPGEVVAYVETVTGSTSFFKDEQ